MRAVLLTVGTAVCLALVAATNSHELVTAPPDLTGVLTSRPPAPAGVHYAPIPRAPALCGARSSFTLADLRHAGSACPKTLVDALTHDGLEHGLLRAWSGTQDKTKITAHAFGYLFRTSGGAHAALRVLAAGDPTSGLGAEARAVRGSSGATYLWRRRNVILGADIECLSGPCHFYAAGAAHSYAVMLDGRAAKRHL